MYNYIQHYIHGQWVDSTGNEKIDVINPATEVKIGEISSDTKEDPYRWQYRSGMYPPELAQSFRNPCMTILSKRLKNIFPSTLSVIQKMSLLSLDCKFLKISGKKSSFRQNIRQ